MLREGHTSGTGKPQWGKTQWAIPQFASKAWDGKGRAAGRYLRPFSPPCAWYCEAGWGGMEEGSGNVMQGLV